MADDATYLAQLEAKRQTIAGIRGTSFGDQSTTFDAEGLDREIARVKAVIARTAGTTRTRYASFSKGLS